MRLPYLILICFLGSLLFWGTGCDIAPPAPGNPDGDVYRPFVSSSRTSSGIDLEWGWLESGGNQQPQGQPASEFRILLGKAYTDSLETIEILSGDQFQYRLQGLEKGVPYKLQIESWVSDSNARKSPTISFVYQDIESKEILPLSEQTDMRLGSWGSSSGYICFETGDSLQPSIGLAKWEDEAIQIIGSGQDPSLNSLKDFVAYETPLDSSAGALINAIQTIDVDNPLVSESILGGDSHYQQPTWSSDGEWMAYLFKGNDGHWGIYEYNPEDGALPQKITSGESQASFIEESAIARPTWSADRQFVAFEQFAEKEGVEQIHWRRDIFMAFRTNGELFPFVSSPWDDYAPSYSQSGSKIAFISNRSGKAEIWLKDTNSRMETQLTGSPEYPVSNKYNKLSWSFDDQYILYTFQKENGQTGLCSVKVAN
ncbi:MAG: hypothetical protein AAFY71_00155 [Bacteroidota bacterium]